MGVEEVIQWAVLGWRFEVTVHVHQAGSLVERMRVACHRRTQGCPGGGLGPTSCERKCTKRGEVVGSHLGRWINCLDLGFVSRLMPPRLCLLHSPNPLALFQRVTAACLYFPDTVLDLSRSLASGRRQRALGPRHSSRLRRHCTT
jgi:hypothetical protein